MSTEKSGEKRKASADKPARKDGNKKPRLGKGEERGRVKAKSKEAKTKTKETKETKETKTKEAKTQSEDKEADAAAPSLSSREAHAKQKQLAQERRAAKPLAEELARAKQLWERLRRKSHVPREERQVLVDELFGLTTGRIRDFVLKHDAVRAVQTAVKYANAAQRQAIAHELAGAYAQLAESKYAKFLVGKLVAQTDDATRAMILGDFYGKVRRLIHHPEASWILDDMYRGIATPRQKARLLREWYGPEFALANRAAAAAEEEGENEESADLVALLEKEPSRRGAVLEHLLGMINGLVQKKLTGFTMLHDAMLQYFLCVAAGPSAAADRRAFMELVKDDEAGDLLKNMAFTAPGARLVCLLLAHGDAKDRKHLLRAYKDTVRLLAGDAWGHAVLLAAYDLVDDTKLVAKAVFPELLGREDSVDADYLVACALDPHARTTLLYLLEGTPAPAVFPASHAGDVALLAEIHAIRTATSKKDPDVRRRELVAAASPQLLAGVAAAPQALVASSFGCQLVADVLLHTVGDKTAALAAVAEVAAAALALSDAEPTEGPLAQDRYFTRLLKTLVAGGRFDRAAGRVVAVDPPLRFADVLYPQIRAQALAWATGSASSFVVVALLEAADLAPAHAAELRATLRAPASRAALQKAATEETAEQKAWREAEEAKDKAKEDKEDKEGKAKDKAKAKKAKAKKAARPVGNAGAKLLLEMVA